MSKTPALTEIAECRTIEALQNALDHTYRRLLETAKADWMQLFAGQDLSDESVSVRISKDDLAEELAGIPRASFAAVYRRPVNGKSPRRRS